MCDLNKANLCVSSNLPILIEVYLKIFWVVTGALVEGARDGGETDYADMVEISAGFLPKYLVKSLVFQSFLAN